jgi:hypothetical protein
VVRALALALALALAGCGASALDADFTGIEARVSFPRGLGLDAIRARGRRVDTDDEVIAGRFAPLRTEGGDPLVEPLLFLLQPELAGAKVEVDLDGLDGDEVLAQGRFEALLRLGAVVTASTALVPTSTGT